MLEFGALAAAEGGHGGGTWWSPIVYSVFVFFLIVVAATIAVGEARRARIPRNAVARVMEHVYLFIENMCVSVIGPHGTKYVPFVSTIFLFILLSNLLGILGLMAPTSVFGVTFGLAVVTVMYVQYEGIRANGFLGYVKHFLGPELGIPWYAGGIFITLLLFGVELISEAAKMLSLSLRLYGNISGEHEVGAQLGNLVHIGNFGVPLHALLLPLGVFVSVVQALVFTILACVYLSLMTAHEAEGHAH